MITSPNGGETWAAGSTHTISWTYTGDPGYLKIDLLKGGSTSTLTSYASKGSNGSGSYTWRISSNQSSGSYQIRITSRTNGSLSDTSDDPFTITGPPPPSVSLSSPNGGETWAAGSTHTISWTYTGDPGYLKIDLLKGGSTSTLTSYASKGSNGSGSYTWRISSNQSSGSYQIRITSRTNGSLSDTSDDPFTITGPPPPSVSLSSPNGGETWAAGSTHTISWTYTGDPGYLKIDLLKGGSTSTLTSYASKGSNGSGSYTWRISSNQSSGSYQIRITSRTNGSLSDTSDDPFTITGPPPPSVSLSSPNGGETWAAGSTHTISWTYTGDPGYLKIDLLKGGSTSTLTSYASKGSNGSGSYTWRISSNQSSGSYQIRITSRTNGSLSDTSDDSFTITGPPPPSVSLSSPNGGETWAAGSTHTISWTYTGDPRYIRIVLLNGGSASTITSYAYKGSSGSGSYTWRIPSSQSSGSYKIRIISFSDASISDTSDDFFTIN